MGSRRAWLKTNETAKPRKKLLLLSPLRWWRMWGFAEVPLVPRAAAYSRTLTTFYFVEYTSRARLHACAALSLRAVVLMFSVACWVPREISITCHNRVRGIPSRAYAIAPLPSS